MSKELVHPELAGVQIDEGSGDLSRSEVILKGALAVGAVFGAAAVGPFVRDALASRSSDVDVLNFVLLLTHLEFVYYQNAYENHLGDEKDEFLTGLIGDYEPNHAEALVPLIEQLGGKPAPKPKFDFHYKDAAGFWKLAQKIQDTAAGACNGAIVRLEDEEAIALVGSIAQGEARFAAMVRVHNGEEPAPDAFEPALTESQTLAIMEPFIK